MRQGSWERKIWEDLANLIGERGVRVDFGDEEESDGTGVKLNIQDASALKQIELQLAILAELRKMNFLIQCMSDVDVDVEAFNGRN